MWISPSHLVCYEDKGLCTYMDFYRLVYIFSVRILFSKYTPALCSDPKCLKSKQTHHVEIFPNLSCCFSFVKCKNKLVQSSTAPGLSVLHLLR